MPMADLSLVTFLLLVPAAYLLGAIPFGLLLGRLGGRDIRREGSGNIGATNLWRLLGWRYGLPAFLLDFAKGLAPVLLACPTAAVLPEALTAGPPLPRTDLPAACGLAAVLGHVFPVYLGFRGGKGVATAAGCFAGLTPISAGTAFGVWLALLFLTGFVAVGSIGAAIALPIAQVFLDPDAGGAATLLCALATVLVVVRHRSNVRKLMQGTEEPDLPWKRKVPPPAPSNAQDGE